MLSLLDLELDLELCLELGLHQLELWLALCMRADSASRPTIGMDIHVGFTSS